MSYLPCHHGCVLRWAFVVASWVCVALGAHAEDRPSSTDIEYFESAIRPLLIEHCLACHGPDRQESNLRLDSRAAWLKGGDGGAVAIAHDPTASRVVEAVTYQADLKMPPAGQLDRRHVESLSQWIQMGLPWSDQPISAGSRSQRSITEADRNHWSFRPVVAATRPEVRTRGWSMNAIEDVVLAALESHQLTPGPRADLATLIRRATFDLTGLPPTPEETRAFVADRRPDAYARLIDRLLASPAYGERWGRHWLDVVRYADARDLIQLPPPSDFREIWRYRDWVVWSFNHDLPYDQFVKLQLAGDLMQPQEVGQIDKEALIATGFLALADFVPGDVDKELMVADYVDDMINAVGQGMLGLTLACARCHDHKFDPITIDDYYGLAGIFFSTSLVDDIPKNPGNTPLTRAVLLTAAEQASLMAAAPREPTAEGKTPPPVELPQAVVVRDGGPQGTRFEGFQDAAIFMRGNPKQPGERVPRRFPTILSSTGELHLPNSSGRRELAEWIASADHPLTARVLVNRLWQHHFGEGIVRTTTNFGVHGEPPSHPELLDYLAAQLIQSGWSIKTIQRQMMLSAAYQQSSHPSAESLTLDPENRWLSYFRRQRLEAEAIRDNLLAVAGQLDRQLGGAAFSELHVPRRTLYLMSTRTGANTSTFGGLFDRANCGAIVGQRSNSIVAPQSLFFMNDPLVETMATETARRIASTRTLDDWSDPVQQLYEVALGRAVRVDELQTAIELLEQWTRTSDLPTIEARQLAWRRYCLVVLCTNEFVFID